MYVKLDQGSPGTYHTQLGVKGEGIVRSTVDPTEITISTPCMVFILLGNVTVGNERLSDRGTAYRVEDEKKIMLGNHTSVVLVSSQTVE